MADSISIERASEKDLKEIINLSKQNLEFHNKCSRHSYLHSEDVLEQYEKYLISIVNSKYHFNLILKLKGEMIGYMLGKISFRSPYLPYKKVAEIDDAFINEKNRRKGYGEKLLNTLFELLKKENVEAVYLLVDSENIVGKKAWEKYGFKSYQEKLVKILV